MSGTIGDIKGDDASGATKAVTKGLSGAQDTLKQGTEKSTGTLKIPFGNWVP